nr:deoxyuridine 5'-triphosphate nucleotidohydrolase-like [Aegilops tauschii subsp. strangulata]
MAGPELAGSITGGGGEPPGAASSTPASGGRRILRTQTAGNLGESIVANEVEASNPHVACSMVQDLLTSLKMLAVKRAETVGRPHLADPFDLRTLRAIGVIDVDYCGLVGIMLFNHSEVDFIMKPGDRAAQMIVQVIAMPEVAEVEDLDAIVRREGVFGSTDV